MPRVLIVGGGGVLGHALAQHFAASGHAVVGLRRHAHHADGDRVLTIACDLAQPEQVHDTVHHAIEQHGPVDVLIHNAMHFVATPFLQLAQADLEAAWRVGVAGAVAAAQAALPSMLRRGRGTIVFAGATASQRGSAGFAAFSSVKFALRGLAQSLAREFQPQGVHVAHVVIDGLLRGSPSVQRFGADEAHAIDPLDVARACHWLCEQPRSAWTHELDLRQASERF